MKMLVTGGHGFLGSHLVGHLLEQGHEVKAMASPWGKLHNLAPYESNPKLEIVRGDITNAESLDDPFKEVEVVHHFAARVLDWGRWSAFERTNVEGTRNVLDAAERAGVQRFVQVSSVAVHPYTGFRDADPRTTSREGKLVNYAKSKKMAEDLVNAAQIESVIVRPGLWPYGPRDPNFIKFVEPIRKGGFPLVAGGKSVINTVYADNLSAGLELAATVKKAAGGTYLIADEGSPDWEEVLGFMAERLGAPRPKMSLPGWLSAVAGTLVEWMWAIAPNAEPPLTKYRGTVMNRDVHFSIAQAIDELGYAPKISWQEGFERTVDWFLRQEKSGA